MVDEEALFFLSDEELKSVEEYFEKANRGKEELVDPRMQEIRSYTLKEVEKWSFLVKGMWHNKPVTYGGNVHSCETRFGRMYIGDLSVSHNSNGTKVGQWDTIMNDPWGNRPKQWYRSAEYAKSVVRKHITDKNVRVRWEYQVYRIQSKYLEGQKLTTFPDRPPILEVVSQRDKDTYLCKSIQSQKLVEIDLNVRDWYSVERE